MTWTPERIETLCAMWNRGESALHIGKRLGVSKNAVVGKAHRLGLPGRPSPILREKKSQPLRVAKPPKIKAFAETKRPAVVVQPGAVLSRWQKCQWPMWRHGARKGEAGYGVFCSGAAIEGRPYCPEHCAVAYVRHNPPAETKEAA